MKEANWEECLETNSSIKITPNTSKVKSLIETAKGRNLFLKETKTKPANVNYIFEGYYSSAMELLHALVLLKGYKVSNHICLGYYLRDILKKPDLFRIYDDCRYKRNSLVYYGRKMDFEAAKASIKKCKVLIQELLLLLK